MLEADFQGTLGELALDVTFEAGPGVTALVGPSGAGKSTILRALCGLWKPDSGTVVLDGRVLFSSADPIDMPPHRRRFGAVFQEVLLFPHMNVRRNIAYGAPSPSDQWDAVIDLLEIGPLLKRMPRHLSGGEAQRVALARALLSGPDMLLLDEPLTGLEDTRRSAILPFLLRVTRDSSTPILYVSHRKDEIAQLAERIVRVEKGRTVPQEYPT